MKKIIAILICVAILASALAGCGGAATPDQSTAEIKVVTTIFPIYDWVRNVAQDDVDIKLDMLLDNGVDLHSYQPSAADIMDISDCDGP